jgi:hypothetical protein
VRDAFIDLKEAVTVDKVGIGSEASPGDSLASWVQNALKKCKGDKF